MLCLKFTNLVITKFRINEGIYNGQISLYFSKLSENNAGFSKRKGKNHEKLLQLMLFKFILVLVYDQKFPTSCCLMDSKSMLIFQLKFHMLLLKIWVPFPSHCMTGRFLHLLLRLSDLNFVVEFPWCFCSLVFGQHEKSGWVYMMLLFFCFCTAWNFSLVH